jgi:hypothetical protein
MTRAYKQYRKRPRTEVQLQRRGQLWQALRTRAGLSLSKLGQMCGLHQQQVWYRCKFKSIYTVEELVAMRSLFNLSWQEFGEILETIASD